MHQVARLSMFAVAVAVALGGAAAHAAPDAPAAKPCVNRAVQDGARRTLHSAAATATAVTFCTGEDCWSLDLASGAFSSIPTVPPAPARKGRAPGASADGRATATATEVAFCPAPGSCKKFALKFDFEPGNGVYPMINAPGTLGAVIYAGIGEDDEPSYVLAYDLVAGKLIKQIKQTTAPAEVFRNAFLINGAFYSARLKKLAKQAIATADVVAIPGGDLVAMSDENGLVIQDTATGKARARLKLGGWVDQKLATPDGKLYAIVYGAHEGEVFAIDVARNKVAAHLVPPTCAAGTARPR